MLAKHNTPPITYLIRISAKAGKKLNEMKGVQLNFACLTIRNVLHGESVDRFSIVQLWFNLHMFA